MEKELPSRLLPRDVSTRWNSVYDMLIVAKQYQMVIDEITARKEYKLRRYELTEEEWQILDDLMYVLRVSAFLN